jgi:hypothetical protein
MINVMIHASTTTTNERPLQMRRVGKLARRDGTARI